MTDALPLRPGASGDAVRDVQRRLARLGFDVAADPPGLYGTATEQAARAFQATRGLRADGIFGEQSWASLVEAGYRLGDRLLYLRAPMLRGDDVSELQEDLGRLGFDAGRVDGIFGPRTVSALEAFQRNAGLTIDGVAGPDTLGALRRVLRPEAGSPVAQVREVQRILDAPRQLEGRRIGIGETGGLSALADAVGRALTEAGALVAVLHHPDDSVQASEANAFEAEAFVSLVVHEGPGCTTAFYAARGFSSIGGRGLAALLLEEIGGNTFAPSTGPDGMQLPILRETRMAAVVCELGPPAAVVEHTAELAAAVTRAIARWARGPADGVSTSN